MDQLIIASADGHACMPGKLWPVYLDKAHHHHLDRLRADQKLFGQTMCDLSDAIALTPEAKKIFDTEGAYAAGGWQGLWNLETRLREMDREGVAAELVFPGDHHSIELFWNTASGTYGLDAVDAGVRAFNRWSYDTFGPSDRLLRIAAPISGLDMKAALEETRWLSEHGFTGVFTPGYCALPGQPPLFDVYWDKLWAEYAARNLVLITHAGWGLPQGFMHSEVESAAAEVAREGGGTPDLLAKLQKSLFRPKGVFSDLRSRRGMWQLMLGGVFDRHPDLKMMVTEIRADWLPVTLKLLDTLWEQNRDSLPAKKRPSEYWRSNCMAGLSFMNRAEFAMRHEIGIETMAFGRDYPHTETTWPNTLNLLSDLMQGAPESEVRAILGENMLRLLKIDALRFAPVAQRIGPTYRQIAEGPALAPALKAHLDLRCGFSNPPEGEDRVSEMAAMLDNELPRVAAAGLAFAR